MVKNKEIYQKEEDAFWKNSINKFDATQLDYEFYKLLIAQYSSSHY